MANDKSNGKLSVQDFVIRGIEKLRDESKSKGIHTRFSGFNEAFRAYFDGADPVEATKQLEKEGVIAIRFARGGAIIYLAADAPVKSQDKGALDKILS